MKNLKKYFSCHVREQVYEDISVQVSEQIRNWSQWHVRHVYARVKIQVLKHIRDQVYKVLTNEKS